MSPHFGKIFIEDEEPHADRWMAGMPIPTNEEDIEDNLLRFSYSDVLIGKGEYAFDCAELKQTDYHGYFTTARELCRMTYGDFCNTRHSEYHVLVGFPRQVFIQNHFSEWTSHNFKQAHNTPDVGQFAVFPKEGLPHRIHFYVGPSAVLHIVAYDYAHTVRK